MADFTKKSIVITGAGSGIGQATAIHLASLGGQVLCADLSAESLEETTGKIREAGGVAAGFTLDVRDASQTREMAETAAKEHGGIDVLVNCAGIFRMAHTTEMPTDEWERVIAINLTGSFFTAQAVLPHLLETGGNIVNIASSAGLSGQAYNAAYCASKGGVIQMTRALAVEYSQRGVRVNCICPGGVATPMTAAFSAPEGADPALLARLQLAPLLGTPEEIAVAIAYLASEDARYISGATLAMDAGASAA